jgi:hypothetical protein
MWSNPMSDPYDEVRQRLSHARRHRRACVKVAWFWRRQARIIPPMSIREWCVVQMNQNLMEACFWRMKEKVIRGTASGLVDEPFNIRSRLDRTMGESA